MNNSALFGKFELTAIAKNHTNSFSRASLTYSHYNSIRNRAFIAMGVISIALAVCKLAYKPVNNSALFGKFKRTEIAKNHMHSFSRASLTYSHYNSIRNRAFIAMGVISIALAVRKLAYKPVNNSALFGKFKRTAIAKNHMHSFSRASLTYSHYNSIRNRAFIAMGVISIALAVTKLA